MFESFVLDIFEVSNVKDIHSTCQGKQRYFPVGDLKRMFTVRRISFTWSHFVSQS